MAATRWKRERETRDAIAAKDPVAFIGRIVRRIVVIENETTVKEAVIYDFDSARIARSKIRALGL